MQSKRDVLLRIILRSVSGSVNGLARLGSKTARIAKI